MPILNVQVGQMGLVGVAPQFIYINTNDTVATITTAGYLNPLIGQGYSLSTNDLALVATKTTPSATVSEVSFYNITKTGDNWSLTAQSVYQDLDDGQIFVGNTSNVATGRTMSGDVTLNNTGVATIANLAVTEGKIANLAVAEGKIANLAVSAAKLQNLAVLTEKIETAAVTTEKIEDSAVTTDKIGAFAVTIGKLDTIAARGVLIIPISFEANEQFTHLVQIPQHVRILNFSAVVTTPLSGTDDATIDPASVLGTMADGQLTFPASSVAGTVITSIPTTNQDIAIGTNLILAAAKPTAGGRVTLYVYYQMLDA